MSDGAVNSVNPEAAVDLRDPKSWPKINVIAALTATEPSVQHGIIKPMITAVGLMSARLMTYNDDWADETYASDPLRAQRMRREIAAFARQVTGYFAENITCFTLAKDLAMEDVEGARRDLLHGVTVACKHAPELLKESAIAGAVAQGFEDYTGMTPAGRQDQRQLIDVITTQLVEDKFGDVPAHMEGLAHQINQWGRKAADDDHAEDVSPSPGSRADALSRIMLNRIGLTEQQVSGILENGEYGVTRPGALVA